MHELILIERDFASFSFWSDFIKRKKISELSVEEILSKYKGFEGELISTLQVTEDEKKLEEFITEYLEFKKLGNCLLLYITSSNEIILPLIKKQIVFLGYEFGICEKEKTIYSSIFNEILFGVVDELVFYKDFLNENLLFPDYSLVEKYSALHAELSKQEKNVEDYEQMNIYEVWKYKEEELFLH